MACSIYIYFTCALAKFLNEENSTVSRDEQEDTTIYKVVLNHEEQ